jgi:kynurenine formamidase
MMRIIDLSHIVSSDMPVYPGTEQPELIERSSLEEAGFLEKKITFSSHVGTHVDAPAHMLKDAQTLDSLEIDQFFGPALMVSFDGSASKKIDVSGLDFYSKELEKVDFLIVHTGWSTHWGTEKYFVDYPVLTVEAATWLKQFHLKGVGLDTISADTVDSGGNPIHKALLQENTIIIENLTNLSSLSVSLFNFSCFPIKFVNADGSPVRAVAYV